MARRYYRRKASEENRDDAWVEPISVLFVLGVAFLALTYWLDRPRFWLYITATVALVVVSVVGVVLVEKHIVTKRTNSLMKLLSEIKSRGLESEIGNFINTLGVGKRRKGDWVFRDHSFAEERLSDLLAHLKDKGLNLGGDALKEVLRHFIEEKERALTVESITNPSIKPSTPSGRSFSSLSGPDFERLLARLFGAMGYAVQMTGGVGDQGADLIASKSGERLAIQAKRYTGTVGNDAVREAAAAKNHYSCTRAIVMTTGYFTDEAVALAKTNDVALIFRKRLQEVLLQYLSEDWR